MEYVGYSIYRQDYTITVDEWVGQMADSYWKTENVVCILVYAVVYTRIRSVKLSIEIIQQLRFDWLIELFAMQIRAIAIQRLWYGIGIMWGGLLKILDYWTGIMDTELILLRNYSCNAKFVQYAVWFVCFDVELIFLF